MIRGGCGKKLRRFQIFCYIRCLEIEASQRKDRSVEQDSMRFGVEVTIELSFDNTTLFIRNREQTLLHVIIWYFFQTV
jgi:hypothetical protein